MKFILFLLIGAVLLVAAFSALAAGKKAGKAPSAVHATSVYEFTMNDIDGAPVKLEQYRGKVLLIVNVASKCGFTPQYEGLEKLYTTYKDAGLVVLGFPANNFMRQEPGSNDEIKSFCSLTYGVTFPMFSKISVKGADQHPLYAWLTGKESNPDFAGDISWNFNKFLVNREGHIIARFGSRTKPEDPELVSAINKALSEILPQ
ncbi:MAG TPA: glutathione peroxidase [bacterium]|nr:glutathione peroxidase [bacterium]HQG47122.1 glutathione peroxidase [bacterium]HQI50058.1 glutathione peroxidase [bacterium]HQJ64464.1 glutathione peroxidase [bacterium]